MEMKLPEIRKNPATVNPRKLFLFSAPKTGKTEAVSQLKNCLVVDLERGSDYISGTSVFNVHEIADKEGINPLQVLKNIITLLKIENAKAGKCIYDYIAIDTVSALDDLAWDLATMAYKATPIGKNFKGDSVRTLDMGAGYGWHRDAFKKIYTEFEGLADKCLILIGHVKDKSITKEGKALNARDISLTGKVASITAANMDAIGFIYRDKSKSINFITFKTSDDLVCGARPQHLSNEEFIISEKLESGELKTYWNKVFLPE